MFGFALGMCVCTHDLIWNTYSMATGEPLDIIWFERTGRSILSAPIVSNFSATPLKLKNLFITTTTYDQSGCRSSCKAHLLCEGHVSMNVAGNIFMIPQVVAVDKEETRTDAGRLNWMANKEEITADDMAEGLFKVMAGKSAFIRSKLSAVRPANGARFVVTPL